MIQDISKIQNSLENIILTENSLFNMVRSVVETYPKESMGFSWGYPHEDSLILTNSFPVQTAKRAASNVSYSDMGIAKRLRNLDFSISSKGNSDFLLVGGYHSHPGPSKIYGLLSKGDLGFIEEEIENYFLDFWIENLLTIKDIEYKKRVKTGYQLTKKGRDILMTIRTQPKLAYKISVKSFLVDMEGKPKKLNTVF